MLTNNGGLGTKPIISLSINTSRVSLRRNISSLELGVQTSAWGGNTRLECVTGPGQYVTPDDNPSNVYQRVWRCAIE